MLQDPRRILIAAAWLATAALPAAAAAGGSPSTISRSSSLAALVEPRPEQALVAGRTATLAWSAGPRLASSRRIEEWEAFLSVDGGAHYVVRLTPHLDRDLHRIRFHVPDLPTADARILLRFGDERQEAALELPQRFAIVRAPFEAGFEASAEPARTALRSGEPARPGEAGVGRWAEGSRRGGEMREVESVSPPGARGLDDSAAAETSLDALAPERPPDALAASGAVSRATAPPPRSSAALRPSVLPHFVPNLLLLSCRRNE